MPEADVGRPPRPNGREGSEELPVWDSAFDAPILAGNVAHELTNALFALHLHLDPVTGNGRQPGRRNRPRAASIQATEASCRVIESILGRLDELSRGLRLVARVPKSSEPSPSPLRGLATSLADWWAIARVVLHVSVPKGIDLHAEWPAELPEVEAEPSELTACAVAIIRRTIGRDRVVPPCTLRMFALPEGRWVRLVAVAHPLSEEFGSTREVGVDGNPERFRLDPIEPRASSMLVARAADAPAIRRLARASGKNP